jgi:protein-disulfide isomerase
MDLRESDRGLVIGRRGFLGRGLLAGAAALSGAFGLPGSAAAQDLSPADAARLLALQPLPDNMLGNPLAPVTMIEYASLTCGHCRRFHTDVLPTLKAKYVDTGKVRYIMREFPLDRVSSGMFVLARCEGDARFHELVELMFKNQEKILSSQPIVAGLLDVLRPAGFDEEKMYACLGKTELEDNVMKVRAGGEAFGVNSTPTFFINGRRFAGAMSIEEFDAAITPLLPQN